MTDSKVAPLEKVPEEKKSKKRKKSGMKKLIKKTRAQMRKVVSIPGCLCCFVLILVFAIVSIGGVGFLLFLSSSITKAGESRDFSFELIKKRVDDVLVVPQTLTKTLAPSIQSGTLNISTSTFVEVRDITYNSLNENFDYFGFNQMMVFISLYDEWDTDIESFVFSWMYDGGDLHYIFKSWNGEDNSTELVRCETNRESPDCLDTPISLYRNPNVSIVTRVQSFTGPTYLPYVYCPDILDENNICEVLIAYAIPVFSESSGNIIGSTGFDINARSLSLFLQEIVSSSSLAFVVDANTNYLLATNRENSDSLGLDKDLTNLLATQKSVFSCGDEEIESIADYLRGHHDGSLQNIPLNQRFSRTYKGRSYIDYYRKVVDGFDTLVVYETSVLGYIWQSLVFGFLIVLFTLLMLVINVSIGIGVIICVNVEMKKLMNSFEKIEYGLRFEEVNYDQFSPIYDIAKLQKKFYYLVKKLKSYSAFLPSSVLEKERIVINESSISGSTISKSEDMSDDYRSSFNRDPSSATTNTGTTSSSTTSADDDESISNGSSSSSGVQKPRSFPSSKESDLSSGSKALRRRNVRKQLKMVSKFALSQSLSFKDITLVQIGFDYDGETGGFIHHHTEFSEKVEGCMKAKRGSIVQMTENRFLIGFNVTIPAREHAQLAVEFALDLLSKSERERYCSINIAVVSGGSSVGILGSSNQKREVVFGEILSQCEQLLNHSVRLECPLLINSYCKDDLKVADYRIDTRDVIFFYPSNRISKHKRRNEIERVFSVKKLENYSSEWMYEKKRKDEIEQGRNDDKIWDLIELNQEEEIFKRIEGRKDLSRLKEIASAMKSVIFSEYAKETIQKKLQFLESIRNLSIFNFILEKEREKTE